MKSFGLAGMTYRVFTLLALLVVCESAMAQGWLNRASGGRLTTPEPIRKIAPNGLSVGRGGDNTSSLAVVSHYIRNDGMVMYGSNSGNVGPTGRYAKVEHIQGLAYYVEPGASNSPLRAPSRDKAADITLSDDVVSQRTEIDANTGTVYRVKQVNGKVTNRTTVAHLSPSWDGQGRPYYQYSGQQVWANNVAWRQPTSQPLFPQQPQNQSIGQGGQQDPGAAIAVGVLQIIEASLRNQRP